MSKENILIGAGCIGGFFSSLIGGWDSSIKILAIFMVADFLSGLLVAGVFKKSKKTENGSLESWAGFKGLCKKAMILVIVGVACQLDIIIGTDIFRDGVIIAFLANETISIIENAGLMGVPIPEAIKKAINILNKKGDMNDDD